MKHEKEDNGPALSAKAGKAKTAKEAKGPEIQPPISRELFRDWARRDLSAARAFLSALAKRPHLVEEMADEMYDSMYINSGANGTTKTD